MLKYKVSATLIAGLLIASGDLFAQGKKTLNTAHAPVAQDTVSLQLEDNYYDITANYTSVQTHYVNGTLSYDTASGATYQLQVINCPLAGGGAQNHECDVYFMMNKQTKLTDMFAVDIGTANGTVFGSSALQWHSSHYAVLDVKATDWLTFYGGSYYANKQLSITSNVFGYVGGFILRPYTDIRIEGQYLSGQNNLSGGTLNFWYKNVYLGFGGGEANSSNEFFGTAGFKVALFKF